MQLLKDGIPTDDPWRRVADETAVPADGPVLVSLARLQADGHHLLQRRSPVGVALRNHEPVEALAPFLHALAVISLEFPKFTDGRAYSQARKLREHLAYAGELCATGQVLRDQFLFMQRCGIDAVETHDPAASRAWRLAQSRFTAFYQPTGDGRVPISQLRARLSRTAAP